MHEKKIVELLEKTAPHLSWEDVWELAKYQAAEETEMEMELDPLEVWKRELQRQRAEQDMQQQQLLGTASASRTRGDEAAVETAEMAWAQAAVEAAASIRAMRPTEADDRLQNDCKQS